MFLSYAPSLSELVAGARGPRGRWGDGKVGVGGGGYKGWCAARPKAAALRWEDGAVIRPSRWLELSQTA